MREIRVPELSANANTPQLSVSLSNARLHVHYGVFIK
jgi:hypothetical protein